MKERLALPTATALGFTTLGLWLYLLLFPAAGVEVTNRSGAVLGHLTVCQSGDCLHRARLWPHQTWRVPLPPEGSRVKLTLREAGTTRQAVTQPSRAGRVHFVLGAGGHIGVQP